MTSQVEFVEDENKVPVNKTDDVIDAVCSGEIDVTPEHVVKTTQVIRTGILREITDHGRRLPTDAEGVAMALSVMKDMDQTALTTAKLAIEETKANSASQVAAIADQILSKLSLGTAPVSTPRDIESTFELPDVDLVPGEDLQGETNLNPEEWLADRD